MSDPVREALENAIKGEQLKLDTAKGALANAVRTVAEHQSRLEALRRALSEHSEKTT